MSINKPKEKVIIANISGFYGDRMDAPRQMLEGGPVDYLTGDYLAELTMAILYKSKLKRPEAGYARSFLKQMEGIMGTCLDKGVKVVVNAGGLNPASLAKSLNGIAASLQLNPSIAYIEGDDLMPRLGDFKAKGVTLQHIDTGVNLATSGMTAVSANAYLGCWGIVEALNHGADIVVTGRVADTSVIMGPAAHHFGWSKSDWDALAGAATAGHIIECSGQASGGNYSFFEEVPSFKNVGFPIAEVFANGDSIITKHSNTGGIVTIGTVTSQLLYEINAPAYITPDVVAHFDTIQLTQIGKDRVQVSDIKGSPATNTAKVTINCMDGYSNSLTYLVVGLDTERKIEILKQSILDSFGGTNPFDDLSFQYFPTQQDNPNSNEAAMAQLKVSVKDANPKKAGQFFTSKMVETALCTVPGICWTNAPGPAKPRIVHFPALLDKSHLQQKVHVVGKTIMVDEITYHGSPYVVTKHKLDNGEIDFSQEPMTLDYLGRLFATRSGDKGGNANLGIFGKTPESYAFLKQFLTVERLKTLLPDTVPFEIIRYDFPNLLGLNFYLIGFLGEGVAASIKVDVQAKTLGEYLRAKKVLLPKWLMTKD